MIYTIAMNTFGERLLWARNEMGLTQLQLGKLAGLSTSALSAIEKGRRGSARKLTEIAAALNVSSTWLATGKGAADDHKTQFNGQSSVAAVPARDVLYLTEEEVEVISALRLGDADAMSLFKVAVAVARRSATPIKRQA